MNKFCYISRQNLYSMNISIDKRKTNIIYVDKENNHIANDDEVLKLVNNCNNDANSNNINIDTYVNIIAGYNNLSTIEVDVLKYLLYNSKDNGLKDICDNVSKVVNKSSITIKRAVYSLKAKGLVYINAANCVIISNTISTSVSKINNAKFIVIELNTKNTSNIVSIY